MNVDALGWPRAQLAEALGLVSGQVSGLLPAPPEDVGGLERWLGQAGAELGISVEQVMIEYGDMDAALARLSPGLLHLPTQDRFALVLSGSPRALTLLTPERRRVSVSPEALRRAATAGIEGMLGERADDLLDGIGITAKRRARARGLLLQEWLGSRRLGHAYIIRLPMSASTGALLAEARAPRRVAGLLALQLAETATWVGTWALLGRGALSGTLDAGWMGGWALLLLLAVALRAAVLSAQESINIDLGALLRQRLMLGALRMRSDEVRHQGLGRLLGRALESEALQQLALGGGFAALLALPELLVAAWVLAQGAAGLPHAALLLLWLGLVGLLGLRLYRARRRWTRARTELTWLLVERMVGQRTRLAQMPPSRWYEGEDEALEQTLREARALDRVQLVIGALLPRGWMALGLGALVLAQLGGVGQIEALAVGLGGVLLAAGALARVSQGLGLLVAAAVSWEEVAPLYRAAEREEARGDARAALWPRRGETLIELRELRFAYPQQSPPAIDGLDLTIHEGDHVLLTGPSGGGKSTLAALLLGQREPQRGVVLLGGLDRHVLGAAAWRRGVTAAPQFHDNHVLGATLAFNLLMGRRWPPRPEDLEDAEEVCRGLGLGPLLETMPSGLNQIVGETGWQLSHGERSRLYLARALLQGAELLILDESFGALDPETLKRCMDFVRERARTLVVIAHP
ncbi:MAG: ATP-binding cassette domain-containing protein [Alphaproteobacteria bacterium]|nr:ATP-binding cassette domain-containing protein [Alphaproteobacteria bacterium]